MLRADARVRGAALQWDHIGAQSYNLIVSTARDCDARNYSTCPDTPFTLRLHILDKRVSKSRPEMGLVRMRAQLLDGSGAAIDAWQGEPGPAATAGFVVAT